MDAGKRGPVYLAEALEKLLSPIHDKFMIAAAARLYPKTIQNIVMRRPVSQVTLDKVAGALKRGELDPKPAPRPDSTDVSARLLRFAVSVGGTVQAAATLNIDALVLAKLMYGRQVNERFRGMARRRLDQVQASTVTNPSLPAPPPTEPLAEDSLAQCRQAYDLYKMCGTLEAVGRRLNLSRERVRQLINRGIAYGVIPAEPHYTEFSHPFPFASREEFLAAYQKTPSMRRLMEALHISKERLKRFCETHDVLPADLEKIRRAARPGTRRDHTTLDAPGFAVNM